MKEYILNIKFGTWQNQLWFMGEDNEEKFKNAINNIESIKKSSEDAMSFQNNVIEYLKKLGYIRVQK